MSSNATRQPAKRSALATKTAVRGVFNLSLPAPETGAQAQKDLGVTTLGGAGVLFGAGNTVPVVAMAAAHQSGTAYRCLERRSQFLEGTGFPVPTPDPATGVVKPEEVGTLGETEVPGHHGQKTANDFWAELCSYGSNHNGAAVLVRYRGAAGGYGIGEVHTLPFGAVRKTANGTFLLNHKFGKAKYKSSDTTEHRPFNPDPEQVAKELAEGMAAAEKDGKPYRQAGQIFYIYTPKAGEEDYPLPPHWAGLEDVLADGAYARFDLDEVRNGFNAKGMIVFVGEDDDAAVDEYGKTKKDYTNDELDKFTLQGADGAGRSSVMVFDVKTKEEAPIWIPMNTSVAIEKLDAKKEAVGQTVCRHIGIPPILAGFAKAGQLGAATEIINAVQLTQDSLEPLRKCLLRAFWRLMPALKGHVPGQRKPLAFVDPAIMAQLTPDEIRALGGYGPRTTPDTTPAP